MNLFCYSLEVQHMSEHLQKWAAMTIWQIFWRKRFYRSGYSVHPLNHDRVRVTHLKHFVSVYICNRWIEVKFSNLCGLFLSVAIFKCQVISLVHSCICDLFCCLYRPSCWCCRLQQVLTSRRGHLDLTMFAGSSTASIGCTTILMSTSGRVRVLHHTSAQSVPRLGKEWTSVDGQVWLQFRRRSPASSQNQLLDHAALLAVVMCCRHRPNGKPFWCYIYLYVCMITVDACNNCIFFEAAWSDSAVVAV